MQVEIVEHKYGTIALGDAKPGDVVAQEDGGKTFYAIVTSICPDYIRVLLPETGYEARWLDHWPVRRLKARLIIEDAKP